MKVYIPTMEELIELQKLGVNIYNYLVIKVTEAIILEDIVYDVGDMFKILDYLGPHPEIIYAICRLYPHKIKESLITSKDKELCKKIITSMLKEDKTVYQLDDVLMNFDESILFDEGIIKSVINFLSVHLPQCPKYHFDYQGPNELLDSIFSCELPIEKINPDSYTGILTIDPIYGVKINEKMNSKKIEIPDFIVQRGMSIYSHKYGIFETNLIDYGKRDIIEKPDENVKRLIKCLEYHKKEYQ